MFVSLSPKDSKRNMYNVKQWMGAGVGNVDLPIDPERFPNEAVLVSDALLPAQLYGPRRGNAALEPVKRLMMAILVDAIRCYQRNFEAVTLRKRREFREAQDWLFKDRNDGPFAFDTVCYVLDTNPDFLRRRLIQLQYAHVATVARGRMIRPPLRFPCGSVSRPHSVSRPQ